MFAGAAHKKGGMALTAALALWVGIVAAGKVGHGVKSCDSQAKPCPGTVAWASVWVPGVRFYQWPQLLYTDLPDS